MGVWVLEFSNWFGRKSPAEMTFQNVKEESRNLIKDVQAQERLGA